MDSNKALIEKLKNDDKIKSENVEKAFLSVDRKDFVPENYRDEAYIDKPIKIGEKATISAPHIIAIITELLEIEENSEVLEIGSGSGYQLAIISELARKAVGIEIDEKLVEESSQRLEHRENVEIRQGSGLEGVDQKFDRILFSCADNEEMFKQAQEYLKDSGVIVAPVIQLQGQILMKYKNGETTKHGFVRFVQFIE